MAQGRLGRITLSRVFSLLPTLLGIASSHPAATSTQPVDQKITKPKMEFPDRGIATATVTSQRPVIRSFGFLTRTERFDVITPLVQNPLVLMGASHLKELPLAFTARLLNEDETAFYALEELARQGKLKRTNGQHGTTDFSCGSFGLFFSGTKFITA